MTWTRRFGYAIAVWCATASMSQGTTVRGCTETPDVRRALVRAIVYGTTWSLSFRPEQNGSYDLRWARIGTALLVAGRNPELTVFDVDRQVLVVELTGEMRVTEHYAAAQAPPARHWFATLLSRLRAERGAPGSGEECRSVVTVQDLGLNSKRGFQEVQRLTRQIQSMIIDELKNVFRGSVCRLEVVIPGRLESRALTVVFCDGGPYYAVAPIMADGRVSEVHIPFDNAWRAAHRDIRRRLADHSTVSLLARF